VNSEDLDLFARVLRAGSLSRAGMELGIDPSTVSRRVAQLEGELGVRLLHRSGRGVSATDQGRQLLGYAEAVGELLAQATDRLRDPSGNGPARLHIGAQPTIARILFGPLARVLQTHYPKTRLRFVEALGNQILDQLGHGELDFAVIYLPEQIGALQFDVLLEEGLHLIAPGDAALSGDGLEVASLGDWPLILPSTPHGIRLLVESLAARHGFTPNIVLECDASISQTKRLVMQGCGCTVLPLAAVNEELADGRLRSLRLVAPEVRRRVGIVPGRNRVIPSGLWKIIGLVKSEIARLVEAGGWPDAVLHQPADVPPSSPDAPGA
jgi:DNA-binding transcriptional LysR family regulator